MALPKTPLLLASVGTVATGSIAAGVMLTRGTESGSDLEKTSTNSTGIQSLPQITEPSVSPSNSPPAPKLGSSALPNLDPQVSQLDSDDHFDVEDSQTSSSPIPLTSTPSNPYTKIDDKAYEFNNLDRTNNIFHLRTFACFNHLFSSASLDENSNLDKEESSSSGPTEEITAPNFSNSDPQGKGCAVKKLQYHNQKLLFRSEIAVQRGNLGLLLWTGIKASSEDASSGPLKVNLIHKLLLLSKSLSGDFSSDPSWDIKGGYAFGGQNKEISVTSLKIQSPDETSINETISSDFKNTITKTYAGLWEHSSSSEDILLSFEEDFHSNTAQSLSFTHKPLTVKGYNIPYAFYDLSGVSPGWKTHSVSNAKSTIDGWITHFKDRKGTWTSAEDYCKANHVNESICKTDSD